MFKVGGFVLRVPAVNIERWTLNFKLHMSQRDCPTESSNRHRFTLFFILTVFSFLISNPALATQLASGPMPGYVGMRNATIWLQTTIPATVTMQYWPTARPTERYHSTPVNIDSSTNYTAHLTIQGLNPGTDYSYRLFVNGVEEEFDPFLTFHTQPLWQWREPPPDFEMVVGSCAFIPDPPFDRPGAPYGSGFEIFNSIANRKPSFMLWLGDHMYLRASDVASPEGIAYRYNQARGFAPLQPLLRATHHVAIWDDHDYGPDNSNQSWIFKGTALQQFQRYWANPSYGLPELPGVFSKVSYGDIDFFLLDNRYHRDHDTAPDHAEKSMFGKAQLRWLKNALLSSTATFKIVTGGSQFLDNQQQTEGWQHFPHERESFLEWFRTAKPTGVMFLSGDRHLSKLIRYNHHVPYPLYELTCSPLTSGPANPSNEDPNRWMVEGTLIGERNFCALTFEGKRSERKLSIGVYTTQGSKLWSRSINYSDLKEPSKAKPDGEK